MKRRKLTALIFALVGITCTGCNSVTTGKTSEPEIGAIYYPTAG